MTKIKFCGLSRPCDIEAANELKSDYIGFVFAPKSKRYVTPQKAMELRRLLHPGILAVGVFVNERPETIAKLLGDGVIDIAQLHGSEDADYITRLRQLTDRPVIQAFSIKTEEDLKDIRDKNIRSNAAPAAEDIKKKQEDTLVSIARSFM